MDVIERSKFVDDEGKISIVNRISATLDFGSNWYGRMEAQKAVTERLDRAFSDQHILLRNIPIPGVDEGEPYMILLSPQGIRILMAFPTLGVFRANERDWLKLNQRSRSFIPAKPNLQTLALNFQKQVTRLLEIQNFRAPVAESVLIFTHPRTLIDGTRPLCRVVSADAIEYFAANLEQLPAVLNSQQIHTLVDAILYPKLPDPKTAPNLITDPEMKRPPVAEPEPEFPQAFFSETFTDVQEEPFPEVPQEDFIEAIDHYLPEEDAYYDFESLDETPESQTRSPKPTHKRGMSSGQRLTIAILVVVEIIIILYFAYIVLIDTGIL
jgi:hypothetical protein